MPVQERLNVAQQETLLTLLCWNDEHGKLVASRTRPEMFEGLYREVAERVIKWWSEYDHAPKFHIATLCFDLINGDHGRAQHFRRLLLAIPEMSEGITTDYVIKELDTFVRQQQLKGTILQAAMTLDRGEIAQAEALLDEARFSQDHHVRSRGAAERFCAPAAVSRHTRAQ
jgi:hypothetical protein